MSDKRSRDAARGADEPDFIVVRGAREHNLNIDELAIPKCLAALRSRA